MTEKSGERSVSIRVSVPNPASITARVQRHHCQFPVLYASDNRLHDAWSDHGAVVAGRRLHCINLAHPPGPPGRPHVLVRDGAVKGGNSRCGF